MTALSLELIILLPRIFPFFPSKTPVLFLLYVLGHCAFVYYETPSNQLCYIWVNLGWKYIPTHFRIRPAEECSSLGWMLWKGFSLPWRGSSDCCSPWTSRHFYVAEITSAFFFFFSECTKLWIWPLWMFLLSLWRICSDLEDKQLSVSPAWRVPLTGFTATASKC